MNFMMVNNHDDGNSFEIYIIIDTVSTSCGQFNLCILSLSITGEV